MLSEDRFFRSGKTRSGPLSLGSWVSSLSILVSLVGCTQSITESLPSEEVTTGLPQVVATTSVLCDLTQQIAQDTVDITCLMQPGQDPHSYAATPGDRKAIDDADLVLYDGYGAAPKLISMVEASTNAAPKVAVYELAVPSPLMAAPHDHGEEAHGKEAHAEDGNDDHAEDGHDHHAEGDDHAEENLVADPHIWHSALNNGKIADVIATQLQQVNPEQTTLYTQNAEQLTTQLAELHSWIETQVSTIPANSRKLITTHEAFNYFADAYGLDLEAALSGISTEETPSAARVAELVDKVKALEVTTIFAETTSNSQLIETLAKNAEVKVATDPLFVEGPGGPETKAETIQTMLVSNTCTIVNALGGTCAEADAPL